MARYFMSPAEIDAVAKVLVSPQRLPNPALVGRPATYIAQQAGISVPADTRVLIAELKGVGRDYPLSIEKLCPVLSFYVVSDWREGCERCKEILRYGGMGHTMSIHSRNDDVILEFGLKKPAYRHRRQYADHPRVDRLDDGLDPAMTLGCGGYGGNITSDNISPRHLLNIKRLAYEVTPAVVRKPWKSVCGLDAGAASPATCRPAGSAGISRRRVGPKDRRIPDDAWLPRGGPTGPIPPVRGGWRRTACAGRTEHKRRKAGGLRMRRRRPAGTPSGTQNCNRGALDRYTGRPRPRGTASAFRPSELALTTVNC